MAASDSAEPLPELQRWRSAFWSAVLTTPLVAGVLGAIVGTDKDLMGGRVTAVVVLAGVIALAAALPWRWPRASGVALGAAGLLLAVGVFWLILSGVEAML